MEYRSSVVAIYKGIKREKQTTIKETEEHFHFMLQKLEEIRNR